MDVVHHPEVRALVVHSRGDLTSVSNAVTEARQEAPLTEVFVWAPGGDEDDVRQGLQSGAADVVVDDDPGVLAASVQRTIDRQVALPRMQKFALARARASRFEGLVSRSARMWELFQTVVQIAPSGASVLILGETGVGKELLARAIHKHSEREGRFVGVNCGSIPETLVDSELFGHEEGTFTGATRSKAGLFRSADQGTLFLDEVANLPLSSQYSLLRALQEGAVRPVGGHTEIPVDARIVAATSVSLEDEMRQGLFREDLLFRLDVIRLVIPPLRERPEDVLHLFAHFRRKFTKQYKLTPPKPADSFLEALLAYDWPGNVRELENLTERLVLTHHGKRLTRRQFDALKRPYRNRAAPARNRAALSAQASGAASATPSPVPVPVPVPGPPPPPAAGGPVDLDLERPLSEYLDALEHRYLIAALQRSRGRINATAEAAGISPRTLLRKLKRHGIDKAAFRQPDGEGGANGSRGR